MKIRTRLCAFALVSLVAGLTTNCIMEERAVDFVLNQEGCGDFFEHQTSANYTTPAHIDFAGDLDEALSENNSSRSQIRTIRIVNGIYNITRFSHDHNWIISGTVTVAREDITDGPDTLMSYSSVSLEDSVGTSTPIPLHEDGVALLHRAIDDYLAGGMPTLVLAVTSGSVIPSPSPSDILDFDWSACLRSHIVIVDTLDVPNPL